MSQCVIMEKEIWAHSNQFLFWAGSIQIPRILTLKVDAKWIKTNLVDTLWPVLVEIVQKVQKSFFQYLQLLLSYRVAKVLNLVYIPKVMLWAHFKCLRQVSEVGAKLCFCSFSLNLLWNGGVKKIITHLLANSSMKI